MKKRLKGSNEILPRSLLIILMIEIELLFLLQIFFGLHDYLHTDNWGELGGIIIYGVLMVLFFVFFIYLIRIMKKVKDKNITKENSFQAEDLEDIDKKRNRWVILGVIIDLGLGIVLIVFFIMLIRIWIAK